MITWALIAIGLVCIVEGLVIVLAPSRLEELLELIVQLPIDARRLVGLIALALGATLLTVAKLIGV